MVQYKVLPLCTDVRREPAFWHQPMNIACYMCGVNPTAHASSLRTKRLQLAVNPHPYPLLSDIDGRKCRELEAFGVVCRTCMKNAPFTGRRIYHASQLVTWNTELLDSILHETAAPGRPSLEWAPAPGQAAGPPPRGTTDEAADLWLPQVPPMLALTHFGGTLEWLHYNDADSVWPFPTTGNPYEVRPYAGGSTAAYRRDFTDTGLCCWGCLQPLGKDGAVPTHYDDGLAQGLFHPGGRCALRYLLEYGGMHWKSRTVASVKMWQNDFGMPSSVADVLRPAPDRRLLKVLGGIFTLEEYLDEQRVLHVREAFVKTYPYYMRVEPDTQLEVIMYEDATTYELQPFDENLAVKVARRPHLLRPPGTDGSQPWRIQLSLMTIEYDTARLTDANDSTGVVGAVGLALDRASTGGHAGDEDEDEDEGNEDEDEEAMAAAGDDEDRQDEEDDRCGASRPRSAGCDERDDDEDDGGVVAETRAKRKRQRTPSSKPDPVRTLPRSSPAPASVRKRVKQQ